MSTTSSSRSSIDALAEYSQRVLCRSVAGSIIRSFGTRSPLVEAPTESTPGAWPGALMLCAAGPSLPAEATTTTPASPAACAAFVSGPSAASGAPRLKLTTSARCGLAGSTAASRPASTVAVGPDPLRLSTL